ncbi:POK10 protein, partial [Daphoenositta chrysoptera]|nr:POK10 protein [Daphoenositta chrysoptera]
LVGGSAVADALMMMATVPNQITQAKLSHEFYHKNAKDLSKQFNLTLSQARQIVHSCPGCARLTPLPTTVGTNLGLGVNEVWQMDVTHISSFGILKYVHISVDTYSKIFLPPLT